MGDRLFTGTALLACLAALGLASCGSDDDDGGGEGSAEPLSQAEFAERATAACAKAQDRSDELNEELGGQDVFAPEAAPLLDDLGGITADLVEELQALEPPSDAAEGYEELIVFLEDGTAKVEEIADAVRDGDREAAMDTQEELNAAGEDIEPVVNEIGLEACLG